MDAMFGAPINRDNVTGIEVSGFSNLELQATCATLKGQYPAKRVVPVALVPMSKHTGDEETARYFAAKHAFISHGLASQFIDRKRTQDRNALKWSVSNIGLAIFAKMGGVPWRVKPSTDRCLVVGIGQAHRFVNRRVERYIAYSVLTDSTGGYETIKILGNAPSEDQYLEALKTNLRQVLVSHTDQYDSFVIHVTFNMKRREIEAIQALLTELKGAEGSKHEFVAIKFNDKNDFFGFSVDHNSRVPYEGTVAPLSKRDYLMWFSGLSLDDSKAPKKPERPVHLRILYPESQLPEADLKRVLQDAMNIAGANWRGFTAKSMPISVYYAKIIADYYAHFRAANLPEVDFETVSPWFL
jgi:Piwi domain